MSLRGRLLLVFAATLLLSVAFVVAFYRSWQTHEQATRLLLTAEIPIQEDWREMRALLWDQKSLVANYLLSGQRVWLQRYAGRQADMSRLLAKMEDAEKQTGDKTWCCSDFQARWLGYQREIAAMVDTYQHGRREIANYMMYGRVYRALRGAEEVLERDSVRSDQRARRLYTEIEEPRRKLKILMVVGVIGYGLALAAILIAGGELTRRLSELSKAVERVGRGSLTQRVAVHGNDEVARLERRFNRMLESLTRARERLRQFVQVDGLTGVYNRHFLRQEMGRRKARGTLALIMFDIDHFKRYNDLNGHLAGDAALKRVARLARRCAGRQGKVVRYGGEEFLMVLPESSVEDARRLAEEFRRRVARQRFPGAGRLPGGRLTVSLGLAGGKACSGRRLLLAADKALYCSKRDGRNRVS